MKNYDIILVGNYGYKDFLENAVLNINSLNINKNIFIYCLDEQLYQFFENKNYKINLVKNYTGTDVQFNTYNTKEFKIITNRKFDSIIKHLQNYSDTNVLYLDGDVVLFKEPDNLNDNYDIVFSADADGYFWVCTGYMHIQNNERSQKLLQMVLNSKTNDNDQEILNDILDRRWRVPKEHVNADIRNYCKTNDIKLEMFNMKECYNGWYLQHKREEVEQNIAKNTVVSIHANCITGKEPKINLLKSFNKWYL